MVSRGFGIAGAVVSFALFTAGHTTAAAPKPAAAFVQAAAIDPALETYEANEARRQSLIARQLDLNYRMIRSGGYGPQYPGVFEPWPRVEGDTYGYRLPAPIAQPVGHELAQVGPNRWIYRPVYMVEAVAPSAPVVAPNARQVAPAAPLLGPNGPPQVQLPAPSDLSEPELPRPIVGKPAAKKSGPREF